jgi:predicted nuclease of predicted toxin-antitoxin system
MNSNSMKVVVDMNLSPLWVNYLQGYGFEVWHWSVVGKPNDPDTVIVAWAKANQAVIFTNDLDFGAILAASQADAPSVFQVRAQDLMPTAIGELVVQCLKRFSTELQDGALITVDLNRTKVKVLPITRNMG